MNRIEGSGLPQVFLRGMQGTRQQQHTHESFKPTRRQTDFVTLKSHIRFGGEFYVPNLSSKVDLIQAPTGRTLKIRSWFRDKATEGPKKENPVLLIPGIGGKTEWANLFVNKIIDKYPNMYGMDTMCFGPDPDKKGDLKDRKDLVREVKDAVDWLSKKHNNEKVVLAGISLGALTLTHYAADNPDNVRAMALVNPAYRPAKHSFTMGFYLKTAGKYILEKLRLRKPTPLPMPYTDDSKLIEEASWMAEARAQVSHLTVRSFLQLGRMTFMEAMSKAKKIMLPTFMAVSGQDTICSAEAMKRGFEKIQSPHKKMIEYPEGHHNILFEKEMVPMTQSILEWVETLPQETGPAKPPEKK